MEITKELIESYEGFKLKEDSKELGSHYEGNGGLWLLKDGTVMEIGWDTHTVAGLSNVETAEEFEVIMKCADFKKK